MSVAGVPLTLGGGGEALQSLDGVAFGENPTVPAVGKTNSAYYEAIAEAINRRKSQGPAAQTLTVTRNGTYDAPTDVLYNKVIVNVGEEEEEVPTGQIIQMMGKTAPSGYLACDGSVYQIAVFPALAAYFAEQFEAANYWGGDGVETFAVPDLRGEFLRGAGTNAHTNQGSGAAVGEHQDATEHLNISFTQNELYFRLTSAQSAGDVVKPDTTMIINATNYISASYKGSGSEQYIQYYTSRPTNTSVLYCIKT